MADTPLEHKEGGDEGKASTVLPVGDEPSVLQFVAPVAFGEDTRRKGEAALHQSIGALHSLKRQQNECANVTLHPVQAGSAKSIEKVDLGSLVVEGESEKAESSKKQDELIHGSNESKLTKATVSQAKDPPDKENFQAQGEVLVACKCEPSATEGASGESLPVSTNPSETTLALTDSTSGQPAPGPPAFPEAVLSSGDVSEKSCISIESDGIPAVEHQGSLIGSSELNSLSTEKPPSVAFDMLSSVSSVPRQEVLADSQGSSQNSLSLPSFDIVGAEGSSTQSSAMSSKSDQFPRRGVEHSVVVSLPQSSSLAFASTSLSTPSQTISGSTLQQSEGTMALLVNQVQGRETEQSPTSKGPCLQGFFSAENKSQANVIGEKSGGIVESGKNRVESKMPDTSENLSGQGEVPIEVNENWNGMDFTCETGTETLPLIVATHSLSQEQNTEKKSTEKVEFVTLEGDVLGKKTDSLLESEPLKPVTIGSSLQPLEEVQEASAAEDASFAAEMAIIDSSADEADSIGGLVINNVIGAADGVVDFHPDEVETEKELTDISASAPQLVEGGDSSDEHGPSAKRRRLENGPSGAEDKSGSAKKVILKVIPVKNGHGVWDSQKLQEVLLTKGTVLLQIHASKESMELFEPDKSDKTIDFSAIMAYAKDDDHDHILSYGNVDPEFYDPLAISSSASETTSPSSYGRPFSHPCGRSTALQPAMSRPGFKHLQTPQQYLMKNEVLGLPPPLEFEDPQMGSTDWSGMDTHTVAFPEPQASPHSPVEERLSPLSPGAESKISRAKVCPECGKVFYKPHSYSMHVRTHRPWLKCDMCPFKTKEAKILKLHKIVHKRNPDNVCDICHKYYSTDLTLRVHQKKFHGIHQCKYCGTEFTSDEELRDHLRKTYDKRENLPGCMDISILRQIIPQSKDADKSQLTCPFCKKVSRNKYQFKLHLAQHRVSSKDTSDYILDTPGELQKRKKQNKVSNKHKNPTSASSEGSTFHVAVKTEDMTEELSETTSKAEVIPELLFNTSFSSAPTFSSGRTLLIYNPVGEALPVLSPHFLLESSHISTADELKRSPATHITSRHCIPNAQAVASSSSTTPLVTSVPDASPDTSPFNINQTSVAASDVTYNEEITEAERKGSLLWCAHCPSAFPTSGDVRKHSQEMHPHWHVPQFPLCRVSKNQMIMKPKTSGPKKHTRKMELQCDVCRNVFASSKVLTKHKKYKHRKSFECSDCNVVHKAAHRLLRHQKLCHKDKYRCRYACGVLLDTYTDLVNHYKRVHQKDYTKSECPYCRKLYVFKTSLKNHIEKCKDCPIDKRPAHTCENCEGVFLNTEAYNEHAKSCLTFIKKYKCNAPSTGLRNKNEAKTLGDADVNVALEPLACTSGESAEIIKGKRKSNESIYSDDLHTSNSSGSSSEECCSTDIRYEIGPRSPTAWCVKCKYCSDVFLEKNKVVSHVLSWHKGLVTRMTVAHQKCEVCGMIFKNATCLCKHLLKHYTRLKMWDAFVPRDILKLVKVEGYYCWICKTTQQLPQYSHHGIHRDMVIDEVLEIEDLDNTAIEPFECDKCSKLFSTRKEFWKHVKNHLADLSREHFRHRDPQDPNSSRLIECSECEFKCAEKDEFYQHITSHFVEEDKATIEINEKADEESISEVVTD